MTDELVDTSAEIPGQIDIFGEVVGERFPIYAFDLKRRTNAQAVADVAALGFLDGSVLDLTLGPEAGFWKMHTPRWLTTNDLAPDVDAMCHLDATDPDSFASDGWDVVAWDPPYGYRGTSRLAMDARYGITDYTPANDIDALLYAGTVQACRMARRNVLVKCQDSCVSSAFRHQTGIVARAADKAGATVVGQLHVYGVRAQPEGKKQLNVWANYSTLMILAVP